MKKTIITALMLIVSILAFGQKEATNAKAVKSVSSPTVKIKKQKENAVTDTSTKLVIVRLEPQKAEALIATFTVAIQLLGRSPDMTAYQASEYQKNMQALGADLYKQIHPDPPVKKDSSKIAPTQKGN